ncbi:Uncharacterised protein [uncultured archaeon]|nr:Uncharacterised protein [uncultured archaeon]
MKKKLVSILASALISTQITLGEEQSFIKSKGTNYETINTIVYIPGISPVTGWKVTYERMSEFGFTNIENRTKVNFDLDRRFLGHGGDLTIPLKGSVVYVMTSGETPKAVIEQRYLKNFEKTEDPKEKEFIEKRLTEKKHTLEGLNELFSMPLEKLCSGNTRGEFELVVPRPSVIEIRLGDEKGIRYLIHQK